MPDAESFLTLETWRLHDGDGEAGLMKGLVRVVDVSSEPWAGTILGPEPEPAPVTASTASSSQGLTALPFPKLVPELLRDHDMMIRVYVTQAFLPFKDSSKIFGPDAEWYIKLWLDEKELDKSFTVTAGDPTRPYLGCVFEFPARLPGPSVLRLELYDEDRFKDDLIGRTEIDLEDRYFNEGWRALVISFAFPKFQ